MRSIRTEKYKYIQNYSFDSEFSNIPIANENSLYNQWLRDSTLSEDTHAWLEKYKTRPFEELYNLENDPFEQHNLAEDETYKTTIQDLRQKLESWMIQQGDLGVATEMKARERMTH
ncbi:hypothetical protein [Fulvivirga ligni]|uniref:hypothetical protein n=1 Tax=Fulvivirga ligni TaxID=2904246 RepID=UPI001F3613F0|nr:hypothetical protein [Fulvivirga ligni]UII20699.1 hypothetical protein LVD16_22930 [Fulvivirga ligni]